MDCNIDSLKPLNLVSLESEPDLKAGVEMSFWSLQISQKPNEFFVRISALAS